MVVGHQRHETRRVHTGILSVSGWPHPTSLQGSHRNVHTGSWPRCHYEIVIGINFTVLVSRNSEFKHCWRRLRRKIVKKYLMQNGASRFLTHANVTPSSADICIFNKSSRLFPDNADSRLDPTTFCQFSSPVRYSRCSSCETQRASRRIVARYSD